MRSKIHEYQGTSGVVRYDVMRCIHAAECVRGLPAVFDSKKRPWVDPSAADADDLARVVARCPTGALHFERADGIPAEETEANTIALQPDGPLYIRGEIEVVAADGTILLTDTRVALCRCGASRNKPLCDGSHASAGFADPGAWTVEPVQSRPEAGDGVLHVVCTTRGPLVVQGDFQLRAADGRTAPCEKTALCRCGASASKPFCDGSHARVGFTGE
jgi:CDGSH-type Zn-finger protein/uncharacterized Fe-S cluster protein YjdI